MAMQVFISEAAFWGLLVSAIEVYKKECYGLLLGHRDNSMFIVDHAVACQQAERHASWVMAKEASYRKIVRFLENLPNFGIVGDFHSHPANGTAAMSREDLTAIRAGEVNIVVEIRDRARAKLWGYNRDGTLSGTTDSYFIRVAAYYLEGEASPSGDGPDAGPVRGQRVRRADILCPFAIGFNIKEKKPTE
jgi:proteasome lid subunit RPN8/RPN11